MMTRKFNLDLNKGNGINLVINCNQDDHYEKWFITCYFDGEVYVPSNAVVVGKDIEQQCSIEDGCVVVEQTQLLTKDDGLIELELRLDDDTHGTSNFYLQVERKPYKDTQVGG